jgi:hypothetical protein
MTTITVWHGTVEDFARLHEAVRKNCSCQLDRNTCSGHRMLDEQRIMDHLSFARAQRDRYIAEEFTR